MRALSVAALLAGLGLIAAGGCAPKKRFDGPTVDSFSGRLTHGGQPVAFPAGEEVLLKLVHEKGESFLMPIQADGSFKSGWRPVGKYSATLLRESKGKGPPRRHDVRGGVTIEEGKTEYTIELGENWMP
jgi:hypothetical protein